MTGQNNIHIREEKLVEFASMVARLETPSEFDERTEDEGMSGDDAVDTVGSLISSARSLLAELGYPVPEVEEHENSGC